MSSYSSPIHQAVRHSFERRTKKDVFLASVFLLSILPRLIHAEQEGDFTYSIIDGAVTITKYTGTGDAVTIPDKLGGLPVRSLDKNIFKGVDSANSVKIPSSVTSHEGGAWAFPMIYGAMASITVDPANPAYCSVDGVLFDKNGTTLLKYPSKKAAKHYEIPHGVTRLGLAAFNLKSELTSVTIPSSVTNIEANNFGGYDSLTTVTFEGNAPEIGGTIFYQTPESLTVRYYKGAIGFPLKRTLKQVEIDPATELIEWISKDNKTIKGNFLKLDGENVFVRTEDGKEHKVPFTRLSPASVAQAKMFGGTNK
jgi:hypothetical protein